MKQKKSLGQNFLRDKNILRKMAESAGLTKKDVVLEAGPGLGTLTEVLGERAKKVFAVEKDRELIPVLGEKFKNAGNIEIFEGDILKAGSFPFKLPKKYKIIANIPYYITSHFLRMYLENKDLRPGLMVLMIQKEVADRIMAKDGKESMLSLSVKTYGKPELIRTVPKGAFSPPPKVDSAIIRIEVSRPLKNAEKILSIAKLSFQKKRKMLRQSIGKSIDLPKKYETKRPEELSLKDWAQIAA